jgi:hypothetical protein
MRITFDTKNKEEVAEVLELLTNMEKTVVKLTETPLKEPETKKTTRRSPKAKKEPVEPVIEKEVKPTITLSDLKESAKNAVGRTNRAEVKKTIGEFADKLADVNEADYEQLFNNLEALGK